MERLKQFFVKHFEAILVGIILIAAFLGTVFIEEKTLILNFYYLPVLVAGYFLGAGWEFLPQSSLSLWS